jgi:AhpD family alkylhydroperoxidase
MKTRSDYTNVPEALRGMYQLEHYIHNSSLEESLVHLVTMRASQINGCAYCLDVHSKDARALGETEQRLYVLDAWEEAPFYSERERAALALTDAVTRITEGHVPDAVFEQASATCAMLRPTPLQPRLWRRWTSCLASTPKLVARR